MAELKLTVITTVSSPIPPHHATRIGTPNDSQDTVAH
jgi:hypothetical protein